MVGKRTFWALVGVLAVLGALLVSPAVGGPRFLTLPKAKKVFFTKAQSKKRFLTKGQGAARFLDQGEADSRYLQPA